jgi:hypothetical protein
VATWAAFEAAEPEMAGAGHKLVYQYGPGLGYLATVRRDGGPRLHPFCPVIAEGQLWAYILTASPKGRDLRRDRRYAMHACGPVEVDDEFYVTGRATAFDDADERLREAVKAATVASVGAETETLFALDIERALLATYTHRGQWPPAYRKWADPDRR